MLRNGLKAFKYNRKVVKFISVPYSFTFMSKEIPVRRVPVNEGDIAAAQADYELIAHLQVCCGIVLTDGKENTMMGHAMRPESNVGAFTRSFGEYITPRESVDALLESFREKEIQSSSLRAHIFGCDDSTIAADTAEDARRVFGAYGIPIATDMTQQGRAAGYSITRLRVTPTTIKVDFLWLTRPEAEIDLISKCNVP